VIGRNLVDGVDFAVDAAADQLARDQPRIRAFAAIEFFLFALHLESEWYGAPISSPRGS
jgi:hypothetical protein